MDHCDLRLSVNRTMAVGGSGGGTGVWRKVLWEESGYPDHYTPPGTFLAAMKRNQNLVLYTRAQTLAGAAQVGGQVCLVMIFCAVYAGLGQGGWAGPGQLLACLASLCLLGYTLHLARTGWPGSLAVLTTARTVLLFTLTGTGLSPVLHQLTDTVSTDSIHTLAGLGFLLHLLTCNYGLPGPAVSWQISLNAAVFSSVCLASRFDDHYSALSLLSLSVFLFLLFPLARHLSLVPGPVPSSLLLAITATRLLFSLAPSLAVLLAAALATVQLLCPFLFHALQSAKQTIHGPWDEASLANLSS